MNKELFEKEKQWLLDEKYGGEKGTAFFTDVERLQNGEPLAYIIGNMPFYNCTIDLGYKPLIPRAETEFWVHDFVETELNNEVRADTTGPTQPLNSPNLSVLDIFSGSGCVGISVLKNAKNVSVDFAEINPKFIKQIKKNLTLNFPTSQGRYKIYHSDVFENLPEKKYDYILANPPYIPESKSEKVQESVKSYENYNSLFAPDNGLYFVKKTILEGLPQLQENGKIYIEFDETSKNEIEDFLETENIKNFEFKKDQFNNDRVLIVWN